MVNPGVGDIVFIDRGTPENQQTGLVVNVHVNDEHDICDVYCLFDILGFDGKMMTNINEWRVTSIYS